MLVKENVERIPVLQLTVNNCVQWHQPIAIEHECDGLVLVNLQLRLVGTRNVGESGIL